MSTDAHPTTDSTPAANGVADPRPDLPQWEEGPNKLPLTTTWREHIRDLRWTNHVLYRGMFPEYVGYYVAVWEEKVIAFGPDLLELRERLKQLPDDSGRRAVVSYMPTAPDE